MELTLVSHPLCPYVQRAAIVLLEKGVPFSRRWVDLADKPGWFNAISPLGKTPVLLAGDEPVFESAVICEYLDETRPPRLHPLDPLQRARHRGWMEFGASMLNTIAAFYAAPDEPGLEKHRDVLVTRWRQLERALDAGGPFFAGAEFSLVDAVFAPVFRYFDSFEAMGEPDFFAATPRVRGWRSALVTRPSVQRAAPDDYPRRLRDFLLAKNSALSRRAHGRG